MNWDNVPIDCTAVLVSSASIDYLNRMAQRMSAAVTYVYFDYQDLKNHSRANVIAHLLSWLVSHSSHRQRFISKPEFNQCIEVFIDTARLPYISYEP